MEEDAGSSGWSVWEGTTVNTGRELKIITYRDDGLLRLRLKVLRKSPVQSAC